MQRMPPAERDTKLAVAAAAAHRAEIFVNPATWTNPWSVGGSVISEARGTFVEVRVCTLLAAHGAAW